jgi:alcohol dehydrogenase class IV
MMVRLVILDADLLASAPPPVIAHSGMDALTQALEAFGSRKATWLTDQFALQATRLVAANLPAVYANAGGPEAEALLIGSHLAGHALAMARLGLVHGLAHPLGARFHAPHGLVCAVALAPVIRINRAAWGAKYAAMSDAAGGDLLTVVEGLLLTLGVVSPFRGRALPDRQAVIEETLAAGSTATNAKAVTAADVEVVLAELFGPA